MNQFEQMTADSNGNLHFILCPHHTDNHDMSWLTSRFIHLIDTPGRVVTLVLCGVCCNTVVGNFAPNIVRTAIEGMQPPMMRIQYTPIPSVEIDAPFHIYNADEVLLQAADRSEYLKLVREQVNKDLPQSQR